MRMPHTIYRDLAAGIAAATIPVDAVIASLIALEHNEKNVEKWNAVSRALDALTFYHTPWSALCNEGRRAAEEMQQIQALTLAALKEKVLASLRVVPDVLAAHRHALNTHRFGYAAFLIKIDAYLTALKSHSMLMDHSAERRVWLSSATCLCEMMRRGLLYLQAHGKPMLSAIELPSYYAVHAQVPVVPTLRVYEEAGELIEEMSLDDEPLMPAFAVGVENVFTVAPRVAAPRLLALKIPSPERGGLRAGSPRTPSSLGESGRALLAAALTPRSAARAAVSGASPRFWATPSPESNGERVSLGLRDGKLTHM